MNTAFPVVKRIFLSCFLLLFCSVMLPAQRTAPTDWTAHWIWTADDGPDNTWLNFRKEVTLSGPPATAITRIAAENKYWLYVNDSLVVRDGGLDIRPDLENTYYDEIDLAPYLQAGENVIAALVWYKGGSNGYSQRTAAAGGFLFQSALTGTTPTTIISDATWKVSVNAGFNHGTFNYLYNVTGTITFDNATFGDPIYNVVKAGYYRLSGSGDPWTKCADEGESFTLPGVCDVAYGAENNQLKPAGDYKWVAFPVSYDASNAPEGWQAPGYDDSVWANATSKGIPPVAPWHMLVHRTIPLWKDYGLTDYMSAYPSTLTEETTITQYIGTNIQGTPYLKVEAPAGVRIRIVANDYYWQEYITKAGEQEFEALAWQNTSRHTVQYQFSNVTGTVTVKDLKFRQTSYNTEVLGSLSSNDAAVNSLWTKCKNTSLVCMRDIFYDCPDRERGQWWGDVSEQILYSFYLYDAQANLLAKKGFRELMYSQKADGSLYTTAPGTVFNLPDQNMAAVAMLWQYYLYTGDDDLLRELYPNVKEYIAQVASTANADSMLVLQPSAGNSLWNWIDWGSNKDIVAGSANTVCNAVYITLLESMIHIAGLLEADTDKAYYESLQQAVKSHFNDYFWNSTASAYVFHNLNGMQSSVIDDRSNAWAVLAGMVDAAKEPGVLTVLSSQHDASPYQEMYIEVALGMLSPHDAITRMKARYATMISSWSSTLWEEFPANGTNNHAWAAGPLYQLSAFVLGIRPTAPAYEEFVFEPQTTALTTLSATVPSAKCNITAAYERYDYAFTQTLTSPPGTVATVGIPKDVLVDIIRLIAVNGTVVWRQGEASCGIPGLTYLGEDDDYLRFTVQPGNWTFAAYAHTTTTDEPVIVYLHCPYAGSFMPLSVGSYTAADLLAGGMSDKSISSLRVKAGYQAILYKQDSLRGDSLVVTEDVSCLVDMAWNDTLSSMKVQRIPKHHDSKHTHGQGYSGERQPGVHVAPNPAHHKLTVQPKTAGYTQLGVVDITGRPMITTSLSGNTAAVSLDVSHLSKGMYYVRITGRAGMAYEKVIVE